VRFLMSGVPLYRGSQQNRLTPVQTWIIAWASFSVQGYT